MEPGLVVEDALHWGLVYKSSDHRDPDADAVESFGESSYVVPAAAFVNVAVTADLKK